MTEYAIIETDAGLTVVELEANLTPEEAAAKHNALLVDPGPFAAYEDACDAMLALQDE